MTRGSFAVLFATLSCISAQELTPSDRNPHGAISGQVIDAATKAPLRKAWLRLLSQRGVIDSQATDGEGRFRFNNVTAGTFRIAAERQGYISREDRLSGSEATSTLEVSLVEDQQVTGLLVPLRAYASITVRVVDGDGDPWVHASVALYRATWKRGRSELALHESSTVDAKGEFRAAALPPGRYFVVAEPDQSWEQTNRPDAKERTQPTWFPGTLDLDNSIPVVLRPGENRDDLELPLLKSVAYRIKGRVVGMDRLPAGPNSATTKPILSLERVDSTVRISGAGMPNLSNDGSFDVAGLRPGRYELSLIQRNSWIEVGKTLVDLGNTDIDDVTIEAVPPFALKVHVASDAENAKLSGVWVQLQRVDGRDVTGVSVNADGNLEFKNIGAGKYFVTVYNAPGEPYIKQLRQGTTESADGVIDIVDGEPLEIVLGTNGGNIWGTIQPIPNEPWSAAPAQVWLIPDTSDPVLRELNARLGVFDQQGVFRIRNIRPGNYRIYAWRDIPEDAWKNSEFLARVESAGTAIKVEGGHFLRLELALVPPATISGIMTELGIPTEP